MKSQPRITNERAAKEITNKRYYCDNIITKIYYTEKNFLRSLQYKMLILMCKMWHV